MGYFDDCFKFTKKEDEEYHDRVIKDAIDIISKKENHFVIFYYRAKDDFVGVKSVCHCKGTRIVLNLILIMEDWLSQVRSKLSDLN